MLIKLLKLSGGMIMGADKASVKFIDSLVAGIYDFDCIADIPKKARRSIMQNRYYFGVVIGEILRDIDDSYSQEQIHEMLKGVYFGHKPVGNSWVIGGDTKSLNTTEMEHYLVACREWASVNLGLFIPLPNEAGFIY